MSEIYGEDLAHIQIAGYGAMARAVGPQIVALLHEQGIREGTIGDVGCGAGITTRCFLDAGFKVWALEQSTALLEAARANASEATYLPLGSVYETDIPLRNRYTSSRCDRRNRRAAQLPLAPEQCGRRCPRILRARGRGAATGRTTGLRCHRTRRYLARRPKLVCWRRLGCPRGSSRATRRLAMPRDRDVRTSRRCVSARTRNTLRASFRPRATYYNVARCGLRSEDIGILARLSACAAAVCVYLSAPVVSGEWRKQLVRPMEPEKQEALRGHPCSRRVVCSLLIPSPARFALPASPRGEAHSLIPQPWSAAIRPPSSYTKTAMRSKLGQATSRAPRGAGILRSGDDSRVAGRRARTRTSASARRRPFAANR
jgi:SAM-dependent methyltransferase